MKTDFYYTFRNLLTKILSVKPAIIFIFSYSLCFNSIGQNYTPMAINADISDTVKVSPYRLPYTVTTTKPSSSDSIKWKVIRGNAVLSSSNSFSFDIRDMKMDTCVLTYTILSTANVVKKIDTLVLINDRIGGMIIDRSGVPGIFQCGVPLTLHSKIRSIGNYTFNWNVTPMTATFSNPMTMDPTIIFNAPGFYTINVTAFSASGYNVINDMMVVNVVCNATTVTKANAGPDKTIAVCQFPIDLVGNIPSNSSETVKWEILGVGSMQSPTSTTAKLLDTKNGTKIKYSITNGTLVSSDTMVVYVNSGASSICDPTIINPNPICGDSVVIEFGWGQNIPGSGIVPYTFSWTFPSDISPAPNPKNSAWIKILKGGSYQVKVDIVSPYNYNTFTRYTTINATCPITTVTKANAGYDTIIAPCQFPFAIKGNAPKSDETVKWEVVSGTAVILGDNSQNPVIADAMSGTKLVYSISNGNETSRDTMVFKVDLNPVNQCQPIISNLAPNCNEIVTINFPYYTVPFYTFNWTLPAGVTEIKNSGDTLRIICDGNSIKDIMATIKTPYGLNTFTEHIFISPKCKPVSIANAGPDLTLYCNRFQLAANKPASGETGKWTIVKGDIVLSDVTNPLTYSTIYESDTIVLVWSITNGFQTSSDTLKLAVYKLKINYFDVTNSTCGKPTGSAMVHVSGGLPPYSVKWQGGTTGELISHVPAGNYLVSIMDQSGCGIQDTVSIKDSCTVSSGYSLEGNVFAGNQLLPYGFALLMQNIGGVPITVKTTNVVNGYYKFTGVAKGEYTVYVLPYKDKTLTELNDSYLPTFYVNKVSILYANPVFVKGNTFSVDIKLVEKNPIVYGPIKFTANVNLNGNIASPLLPVMLYDEHDMLVGTGIYDGSTVEFENLAPGNYYLSMAIEGEGYTKSGLFKVDADKTVDISFENGKLTGTLDEITLESISAYPNPFSEAISIDFGKLEGKMELKIVEGVSGREVKVVDNITSPSYQLATEELPSGFYILQISNGNGSKNVPMIKK